MLLKQKGRTHEGAPEDQFAGSILASSHGADFTPSAEVRSAQCALVLAELMKGPCTTAYLHSLHVLAPAARVMDLRRSGYCIETARHGRQGLYVLVSEAAT